MLLPAIYRDCDVSKPIKNPEGDTMAEGQPRRFTAKPAKRKNPSGGRGTPRGQSKPGRAQTSRHRADTPTNPKGKFARYQALAQSAAQSGDPVQAEYYYQHADHYFRVMAEQAQ